MAREKPMASPNLGSTMTPVGQLLTYYRSRTRLSLRALAKKAQLTHTYVGSIETGKIIPSMEVLNRIADALDLPEGNKDRDSLLKAASSQDRLMIVPGYIVPVSTLIDRELFGDLAEVWVTTRRPLELANSRLLAGVAENLKGGCKYVY